MKRGKKYKNAVLKLEKGKIYPAEEAIQLLKDGVATKFDQSVEAHIKLNIDPKKGEEQTRGTIVLPYGTGKTKIVAVVTSTKAKEAKEAGADIISGEEFISRIKSGKIDKFDIIVATPEMMPKLATIAKILGPKGLMPSPKTETVTEKVKETVTMLKKGKISFKNDDTGNIHQVIGKISFEPQKIKDNLVAFIEAVQKARPAGIKGKFITNTTICSTMGPGIKVNL